MDNLLLEVKDLHVKFITDTNIIHAVNGARFTLDYGESLGLVGETGAGKTTTAKAIMQLIPSPPGIIDNGEILFKGKNIIRNTDRENQEMRGNGISMIFQDPMTSLNPIMTIGNQLAEVALTHGNTTKAEARIKAVELLRTVGINEERYNDYPHQMSGGMKQRVVIAMALLCKPEILIADEPTTALDVTIQAQVLEIIKELIKKENMALVLITHDLGVVAEICNNVAIMYAGEIVEYGSVKDVYKKPLHPYTRGLFDSIPKLDTESEYLVQIDGMTPNPANLPTGCYFHPRCRYKQNICTVESPTIRGTDHKVKCHFDVNRGGM